MQADAFPISPVQDVERIEVTEVIDPNDIRVIRILNPFNPKEFVTDALKWEPGNTLRDYFPLGAVHSIVSVSGLIVEQEDFERTHLERGDNVVVCPVPEGGGDDGGKSIMAMVAMLAVAIFAPYLAAGLVGATSGIAYSMAVAGITMAGSMLVQTVFAPSQKTENGKDSQSYGIDGAKNTSLEGIPVPVCYGRFRTAGNLIQVHTENDGTTDNQILYLLINAGEGPISSIGDILVNDQPIANFKDSSYEVRLGLNHQAPITWFANTITPRSKNLKLTKDWSQHTTVGAVEKIRFDFVAPAGVYRADNKKGEVNENHVDVEIEIRKVGTSTWTGVTFENIITEYREVVLDVASTAGYYTDDDGRWWKRNSDGSVIQETPNVTYRYLNEDGSMGAVVPTAEADFMNNNGVLRTSQYDEGGIPMGVIDGEAGTIQPAGSTTLVPVRSNKVARIRAAKRTPVRRSFSSTLLEQAQYDVRVRRVEDENPDTRRVNTLYLSDINEIQLEPLTYPNTALLGVKVVLGEQITGLPAITFMNGGKIVSVWGKPIANAANEQWFGLSSANPAWIVWDMLTNKRYGGAVPSARLDFTAFKQWAAYCDAEGLEFNGVIDTEMNVWDASQLVLRCGHAQMVNVGTRFGIVVERPGVPVMMFSVANMVKESYKESWLPMSDRANEVDVTFFDKDELYKQKTVKVYDPAALTAGRKQRSSAVTLYGVTDGQRAYKEGQFMMNLNRFVLKTVTFSAPLEALACTVGDLIYVQHDMPNWADAGRLEAGSTTNTLNLDRPVTMETGKSYKALVLHDMVQRGGGAISNVVGNVVFLSNQAIGTMKRLVVDSVGADTRILEITGTNSVRVESAAGLATGQFYGLWDTDVIEERAVVLSVGTTSSITLQSGLSTNPPQFGQWMFGEVDKVKQVFRIRSINGGSDHVREITGIQYDERVYEHTRFPDGAVPPVPGDEVLTHVRDLALYEETRIENSAVVSSVIASWTMPAAGIYKGADVYLKRAGQSTFTLHGTMDHGFDLEVPASRGETVSIKVVAFDMKDVRVDYATAPESTLTVVGEIAVDVGAVSGATVIWTGKDCRLTWRYNSTTHSYEFGSEPIGSGADSGALDPHFKDYEIRVFDANAAVNATPRRIENVSSNSYVYTYEKNHTDGLTRRLKFEIRMRDTFNNLGEPRTLYAENTAPQITGLAHNATYDAVGLAWTRNEDPDFSGTMVWMSQVQADVEGDITRAGFNANLVYDGPDSSTIVRGLMFNADYYVRAAAYDVLGKTELKPSAVVTFHTPYMDISAIASGVIGQSKLASDLAARIDLIDAADSVPGSVAARIKTETDARTTAVGAVASSVSTLQTTVGGHTTSLSAQATSIDGLSGQYTFKIDSNGYLAGFGLASTGTSAGVGTSEFGVRADKFYMVMPSYPAVYPFTIGAVNGVPKVIISSALIGDAAINTAMIGALAVNTLQIKGNAVSIPLSTYATGGFELTTSWTGIHGLAITRSAGMNGLATKMTGQINYTHANRGGNYFNDAQTVSVRVIRSTDGAQVFICGFSAAGAWSTPFAAAFQDEYITPEGYPPTTYTVEIKVDVGLAWAFYNSLVIQETRR